MSNKSYPLLRDSEWLREHHHAKGLNQVQIARLVGCSIGGARAALVRTGLYQPRRRTHETRALDPVDAEQMLTDAATVTSWMALSQLYGVARVVAQDHALVLGIQDQVAAAFRQSHRAGTLQPNKFLVSKDWIAETWGESYRLQHVARAARVSVPIVRRWMRRHAMSVPEMRHARDYAIVTDYLAGQLLSTLAVTYHLDPAAVFRILRTAGVDTSTRKGRLQKSA